MTLHKHLVKEAGNLLLAPQNKSMIIDEDYSAILSDLIFYFNNVPQESEDNSANGLDIAKNLIICGQKGTGKTFTMLLFAEYLKKIKSKDKFINISVTQLINYYKLNGHIDRFTYNEEGCKGFDGDPYNLCIHDLGVETHKHFGVDTIEIIKEFLFARYEVFTQFGKRTHITTNCGPEELQRLFSDGHDRLADRFKIYNILPMVGESKR